MTNCINCGAVLKGDVCEYCGTEYKTTISTLHAADGTVFEETTINFSNPELAEFTADKVAQRLQTLSATGGITAEEAIAKLIALAKAGCT